MLEGILSPAAARLYDDLRAGAVVLPDPSELDSADSPTPAQELHRRGLVKQTFDDPPRLVALEPNAAISTSVSGLIDEIARCHHALERTVDEVLQRRDSENAGFANQAVRVLTDPREINFLSSALAGSARSEILFLNTADSLNADHVEPVGLTKSQREHRVSLRSVYHTGFIPEMSHLIEESMAHGEDARISEHVPLKMVMVDGQRAMLPLERTGTRGALLLEAAPILDALRCLFDFLWERAIPYSSAGEERELTPIESRVVTLLATGVRDEAIAHRLGVTVRTVRRHITAAVQKLGVENRFAAGVHAAKRGWV